MIGLEDTKRGSRPGPWDYWGFPFGDSQWIWDSPARLQRVDDDRRLPGHKWGHPSALCFECPRLVQLSLNHLAQSPQLAEKPTGVSFVPVKIPSSKLTGPELQPPPPSSSTLVGLTQRPPAAPLAGGGRQFKKLLPR